jgi:hypothetical protein
VPHPLAVLSGVFAEQSRHLHLLGGGPFKVTGERLGVIGWKLRLPAHVSPRRQDPDTD